MAHINVDPQPSYQNRDRSPSPEPRSASISLQAAATLNAGLQRGDEPGSSFSSNSPSRNRQSPTADRRRSQVMTNLQIANPSVPGPGEMVTADAPQTLTSLGTASPVNLSSSPRLTASPSGSPYHHRAPSLGELHQELENEQEFQVNRLLEEIRRLQAQVVRQQQGQSEIVDEPTDRFGSLPTSIPGSQPGQSSVASNSGSLPRSPGLPRHHRSSFDTARGDIHWRSRTPSRGSPRLTSASINGESEPWILGGRDENAFYQAETQTFIRENQMLRHRVRELERQLSELTRTAGNVSVTHEPSHSSNLNLSTSASEADSSRATPATSTSLPAVTDALKEE